VAKQVLDVGVYGVIWPQVETVEQARNAVSACRYPRPRWAPFHEPAGQRGDSPKTAIQYWGLTQEEYYERADVWPLNPNGEILVGIMCESVRAIENLPAILSEVPGIGAVLIGEGDLSQDLGFPRQYNHPEVVAATDRILTICKEHDVACGLPHQIPTRIEHSIAKGYRWLMTPPERSYSALEIGRKAAGRS
jgi:4-hydroxy-2-oxoheptanedioate aldolase